ncbi:hypothetical protein B0H63DRAFT_292240 [Podospora didyma]|uniref:Uncharacterized protein n=1 Tax=Podospora didyma TaxID=330526 RepID=A0AAE0N7I4_9PEZI|nr:hypothetical protein B0H63DRAFT_292240 [Podospora didyma]
MGWLWWTDGREASWEAGRSWQSKQQQQARRERRFGAVAHQEKKYFPALSASPLSPALLLLLARAVPPQQGQKVPTATSNPHCHPKPGMVLTRKDQVVPVTASSERERKKGRSIRTASRQIARGPVGEKQQTRRRNKRRREIHTTSTRRRF